MPTKAPNALELFVKFVVAVFIMLFAVPFLILFLYYGFKFLFTGSFDLFKSDSRTPSHAVEEGPQPYEMPDY